MLCSKILSRMLSHEMPHMIDMIAEIWNQRKSITERKELGQTINGYICTCTCMCNPIPTDWLLWPAVWYIRLLHVHSQPFYTDFGLPYMLKGVILCVHLYCAPGVIPARETWYTVHTESKLTSRKMRITLFYTCNQISFDQCISIISQLRGQ